MQVLINVNQALNSVADEIRSFTLAALIRTVSAVTNPSRDRDDLPICLGIGI